MHPRKKLRLTAPDGFEKTPTKPKAKISVPKFTPAFQSSVQPINNASNDRQAAMADWIRKANTRRPGLAGSLDTDSSKPALYSESSRCQSNKVPLLKSVSAVHKDFIIETCQLKTLQPPSLASILPETAETSSRATKSMISPPRFPLPDAPQRPYTLSTTNIARATDISTESGNAELASMLLHHQLSGITHDVDNQGFDWRGLMISPRKKRYGLNQAPQLVRNGLAARASNIFRKSKTSVILWQKAFQNQTVSQSLCSAKADLCMTIVNILHRPNPNPSKQQAMSVGIALCQSKAQPEPGGRDHYSRFYKAAFTFPIPSPHASVVRNVLQFFPGATVFVWKPWHEIKIQAGELNQYSPNQSHFMSHGLNKQSSVQDTTHLIPASFPLPLLSQETDGAIPQSVDTVILCSRFLFIT